LDVIDGILSTAEEKFAPPPSAADSENFTFVIFNNTGFTVRNIFIYQAGGKNWGANILGNPLYSGQSVTVSLNRPPGAGSLYDIRMVDIDGDSYIKYGQELSEHGKISIGIGDFEWEK